MSHRRLSTLLTAMVAAMMVGMRDATGLAPPPPLFQEEVIEWLSTGPDDDADQPVFIEPAAEPVSADPPTVTSDAGGAGRSADALERWFGRLFGLAG